MLTLPTSLRMAEVPALWPALQAGLRAECAQVRNAAGTEIQVSVAELSEFDSGALTVLISAARLCADEGVTMRLDGVPHKLQELARVYGVAELIL